MKNTVVVKERDEWSSLAELIGNLVAKYADELDLDSIPDPELYYKKQEMLDAYKEYIIARSKFPINFVPQKKLTHDIYEFIIVP